MFIPLKFMINHARQNNYSISRFAVTNLESIEALAQASELADSPIVYDIYEPELQSTCLSCLEYLIKKMGSESDMPVAMFSDHVESAENCKAIINKGYSGLMVDASRYSYEENIRITREVVDYARRYGVFVEGELGIIKSGREEASDDDKSGLTDPEQAKDFVEKTGLDCLAVSIGVKSGFYHSAPEIDFGLLKRINSKVNIHLSLHGCSGLSEKVIKECIEDGISFTAWAADIRYVFFEKIDEIRKEKGKEFVYPSDILIPARDKMKDEIIAKLKQAGSTGKGKELVKFYRENPGWGSSGRGNSFHSIIENPDMETLVRTITQKVLKELKNRNI